MLKRLTAAICGLFLVGSVACAGSDYDDEPVESDTGINMLTEVTTTDKNKVTHMKYKVTPVFCKDKGEYYKGDPIPGKKVYKKTKKVKDFKLSGSVGVDSFGNPFHKDSGHTFADYFINLKKGCYDIKVTPMKSKYEKQDKCKVVKKKGVKVLKKGKTTEVILISQCQGKKTAALDVVAGVNYPPSVKVKPKPNKFTTCPDNGDNNVPENAVGRTANPIKFCAKAKDEDDDYMEMVWDIKTLEGDALIEKVAKGEYKSLNPLIVRSVDIVKSIKEPGKSVECIELVLDGNDMELKGKVTVYDLFVDKYGNKIRVEDWYKDNSYGKIKSRDKQKFPIYVVDCDEEDLGVIGMCPRSPGYWGGPVKTQSERIARRWEDTGYIPFDDAYDEGDTATQLCSGLTWLDILPPPNYTAGSNEQTFFNLARHYVAAELNLAAGTTFSADYEDYIDAANDILEEHCGDDDKEKSDLHDKTLADVDYSDGVGSLKGSASIEDLKNKLEEMHQRQCPVGDNG